MRHSIILFADTIEAKALKILDNAQYLEQYGHETLALSFREQTQVLLAAVQELRHHAAQAQAT